MTLYAHRGQVMKREVRGVSICVGCVGFDGDLWRQCASCQALRLELLEVREASEERAQRDHDQCVAMFQRMQELVALNESLTRTCNRPAGRGEGRSTFACSNSDEWEDAGSVDRSEDAVKQIDAAEREQGQVQRLQAIIVQQAKELEALRRRQRDALADGRVRVAASSFPGNQAEEGAIQASDEAENATDSGSDDEYIEAPRGFRAAAEKHASQLRRLPLTSLRAQLKVKDLQLLHLQQLITKMETRFGQLVDRKRSMAQSFQQTARSQQAHLKKYLAYIRQQTAEKKALERQVRELNQYVGVLEKKVVSSSFKASNQANEKY
ncbi:unnamed protein product [Phytophthora lilii]|uniref:Unnamed protein product n=1 Tax=Phytophthora lilii TaxID=2077276 RepID=A0A9W6X8D4_9STRA|nr:unnamed protein product [Phytophthora lilii]